MGGSCGCEYTRSCECLEYAQIDLKRLKPEQQQAYEDHENGEEVTLMGLPKRFPYSKGTGLLVTSYLGREFIRS